MKLWKGGKWKRFLVLALVLLLTLTGLGLRQTTAPQESLPIRAAESPGKADPQKTPVTYEPDVPLPPVEMYRADPKDFAKDEASGLEYVKNIVVVYFAPGTTEAQKDRVAAMVEGEIVGRADSIGKWELAVRGESLRALEEICNTLEKQPGVTSALVDHVLEVYPQAVTSNDPWVTAGFPNYTSNHWYIDAIEAPAAWEANAYLAEAPRIGVIDTGVLASHEEFEGGIVTNFSSINTPPAFGGHSYTIAQEPTWHGTGVVSLIAAKANNGKGLAGLCWNAKVYTMDWYNGNNVNLAPIPVAERTDEVRFRVQESVFFDGLLLCVQNGARAVNFSVGAIPNGVPGIGFSLTQEVKNALALSASQFIAQMLAYSDSVPQFRRFVIVQSAGNISAVDASNNGYFASITPSNTGQSAEVAAKINNLVLVVGAVQQETDGSFKHWTNATETYTGTSIGSQISLYAPGASIFLAINATDQYARASGTSVAAPMVAATAALMSAAKPSLAGWEIGALLKSAAVSPRVVKDRTAFIYTRYPMLNMRLAMMAVTAEPTLQPAAGTGLVIQEPQRVVTRVAARTHAADFSGELSASGVNAKLSYAKAAATPEAYTVTGDNVTTTDAFGRTVTYGVAVEGDLNGDGRANAADAQQMELYLAGLVDLGAQGAAFLAAADVNRDGSLTDADRVLMAVAGLRE